MEKTLSDAEVLRMPNAIRAKFLEKLRPAVGALPYNLGIPIALTSDHIVASENFADGTLTIANQPDVPRNLTVALTDVNNSVTGLLTIVGEDPAGRAVVETMQPMGDGTGKTLVGTKIFAKVTSLTITGTAGAAGGTDVVVVGVGDVIGLGVDIGVAAAVRHVYLDGARQTTPIVAAGVSMSGINAQPYNGAKLLQAWVAIARPA